MKYANREDYRNLRANVAAIDSTGHVALSASERGGYVVNIQARAAGIEIRVRAPSPDGCFAAAQAALGEVT